MRALPSRIAPVRGVRVRIKFWFAAIFIAVSGCGNQGSGDGGNGLAAVQPSRVDPALLREAVSDERSRSFYETRQWQPAWNEETAEALVQAINGASRHGL